MRHQKSGRKFNRTSPHRAAMFSNMVSSLVMHERIETTEAKAKECRKFAEEAIAWGLSVGDLTAKAADKRTAPEKARIVHAMRMAGRVVRDAAALEKLFGEVAPRFKGRNGGYTRVLKTRVRTGDAAPMAFLELVVRAEGPKGGAEAPAPAGEKAEKKAKAPKAEAAPKAEKKAAEKKPAKAEKASAKKAEKKK